MPTSHIDQLAAFVTASPTSYHAAAEIARAVEALPPVMEAWRMAGEVDYLLRVAVADMAAYDRFYKALTDAVPIKNLTSQFAMERMRYTTAYPLNTRDR